MADLRPMNFGEVLDASFSIFRRHFGTFLRLSVVIMAVPLALMVYFMTRFEADFLIRPVAALLSLLPVGAAYYLASLVLTAATIRVISDSYLGREPLFRDAIGLGVARILPLFIVGLGKGVLLGLILAAVGIVSAVVVPLLASSAPAVGVLIVIVAGVAGVWLCVYVACGYGVTTPVVVLEHLPSAFDAFGRSWELTRGSKLRVLGFAIASVLLFNTIPSLVLQAVAAGLKGTPVLGVVALAVSSAVPMLLLPIVSCVFTLMYYDLRVRREAFDLQILSQQLEIA